MHNPVSPRIAAFLAITFLSLSAWAGLDLSAPEALAAAQAGKIKLVDIRTPREWRETGVAPGAAHVDLYQGPQGFTKQLLEVMKGDKDAPIGLICRTGNRTTMAQKYLQGLGFSHIYNIKEGMAGSAAGPGWIRRGLPVESCASC